MTEATVRATFCGPSATSVLVALCADVTQNGRPLHNVACARYTLECRSCQNLDAACTVNVVNANSNGRAHVYMKDVLQTVGPVPRCELELALIATVRQDPEQLPSIMAMLPLTAAPIGAKLLLDDTADDLPQKFEIDAQIALIAAGHCGRELASRFLTKDTPAQPTIAAILKWRDVQNWNLWVRPRRRPLGAVKRDRREPLAARWQNMMAAALNFSMCRQCGIGFPPRHLVCPQCANAYIVPRLPVELRAHIAAQMICP